MSAFTDFWAGVPQGPPDPIIGVTEAFKKDSAPNKINVGVGAYRDENGKPYILDCVQKAEDIITKKKLDHEYAPIAGDATFLKLASELAYGKDSPVIKENRSVSGTGALRVAAGFLGQFYPGPKDIWISNPTWGNHIPLCESSGLTVNRYRYFDPKTIGLDFEGMKEDIKSAKEGSIILLHACAHNPTGIDPTFDQWKELSALIKEKKQLVLFDMGFASGDLVNDAKAVRYFVDQGHQIILCQSFAKNLGLYGERAGTVSVVCSSTTEKDRVLSQLKRVIRPLYSSPPIHGATLVSIVLGSDELYAEWLTEIQKMANRINSMRSKLYDLLVAKKTPGDWGHIKSQIGMFSYTGLKPEQVDALAEHAHIYMTRDGRISMAGLNDSNIEYFADSVSKAVKGELGGQKSAL